MSKDVPHKSGAAESARPAAFDVPHPGSKEMPKWDAGELIPPPRFTWKNWFALLGPGLVMGGAAVGGGEWLLGPQVTATYAGGMLWLVTVSILVQVIYNIEISRYTLYCGEPIFTGKFRTLPGPRFWLLVYLLLDLGSIFPYLAANAATPLFTVINGGKLPNPDVSYDFWLMKGLAYGIFLIALLPLLFGGKIYNSIKAVMTFKLVVVFGFLLFLAFFFSHAATWWEIGTGFFKFGNVPVLAGEDHNANGMLEAGEDWDKDGKLDVFEPTLPPIDKAITSGVWPDLNGDGKSDAPLDTNNDGKPDAWGDLNGDGKPEEFKDKQQDGSPDTWPDVFGDESGKPDGKADSFVDVNRDGYRDGPQVDNVFASWFSGRPLIGGIDLSVVGLLAALAAIAGSGGLSNTPVSNYTRDQGWGMGHHVGAIPSVVGGHNIQLSHVGCVFKPDEQSLSRWRGWYKHVCRDQLAVWMPACFVGVALPCMLSIEFLRRGYAADGWNAAAFTASKVQENVATNSTVLLGQFCWFMVLFCGFLVLAPTVSSSVDGIIRRWVDVFWTSSPRLRQLDPKKIRNLYFGVLAAFTVFGLFSLSLSPGALVKNATMFYNLALGFSCWHTIFVNVKILPKELRPNWFVRIFMVLGGVFFVSLGVFNITMVIIDLLKWLGAMA